MLKKCVERCCELANKTVEQLYKISNPCLLDHQFKQEELESVGELSEVCLQIVLTCVYLARIGRPDILLSVKKLTRSVTKWTQAIDRRLARLISYIHHTNDFGQYCHVGNTQDYRLDLFQDSDFAGDRPQDLGDNPRKTHQALRAELEQGFNVSFVGKKRILSLRKIGAQCAASFHCLVEQWKDCEELRPKPKEKVVFVEKKSENLKHRTVWCAEANKYRCMRCGRGGKCT